MYTLLSLCHVRIPAKTPYSYLFDPSKGIKCSDSSVTCTGGALAVSVLVEVIKLYY